MGLDKRTVLLRGLETADGSKERSLHIALGGQRNDDATTVFAAFTLGARPMHALTCPGMTVFKTFVWSQGRPALYTGAEEVVW